MELFHGHLPRRLNLPRLGSKSDGQLQQGQQAHGATKTSLTATGRRSGLCRALSPASPLIRHDLPQLGPVSDVPLQQGQRAHGVAKAQLMAIG